MPICFIQAYENQGALIYYFQKPHRLEMCNEVKQLSCMSKHRVYILPSVHFKVLYLEAFKKQVSSMLRLHFENKSSLQLNMVSPNVLSETLCWSFLKGLWSPLADPREISHGLH